MRNTKRMLGMVLLIFMVKMSFAYYTTKGKDIIDRETGEKVILRGIGLGGWLLPEGYMWGIRNYDRPWQFEKAITDLIGEKDASEFWRIYRDNYVTEDDIAAMSEWGINTVRIPILASMLQPMEGQPSHPPYVYSEDGFRYLDSIVKWCNKYRIGVIWDMHGAPGAQSEENIANSDGQARLWTEKDKYFPQCIELWYRIAKRYEREKCIVGYDLLNEPLLKRYPYVDKSLLRKIYVLLSDTIRTIDKTGIIFIEGDDWAQTYDLLEPLDWDRHMAIAFHSYPPTSNQEGLQYWDDLRNKYNIPLWHGETGEQRPDYQLNIKATSFLDSVNVGWAWWTHKKIEIKSQPWEISRTMGFQKILDYWMGRAPKPSKEDAKSWLFDQALKTNSKYCEFVPEMVKSLVPLNPDSYNNNLKDFTPEYINQPANVQTFDDQPVYFTASAAGNHLKYQWFKNSTKIEGATSESLRWIASPSDSSAKFFIEVSNSAGSVRSHSSSLDIVPFSGTVVHKTNIVPVIDGQIDNVWGNAAKIHLEKILEGHRKRENDPSAYFKVLYDETNLYILIDVLDDTIVNNLKEQYRNDNIQVYLDPENNKYEQYSGNEYAMMIVRDKPDFFVWRGKPKEPLIMKQINTNAGYTVELCLPWKAIGKYNKNGYMGLEIQITDSDVKGSQGIKLSWNCDRDNAYYTPHYFGVVKMGE
jgi:hypothetical protein